MEIRRERIIYTTFSIAHIVWVLYENGLRLLIFVEESPQSVLINHALGRFPSLSCRSSGTDGTDVQISAWNAPQSLHWSWSHVLRPEEDGPASLDSRWRVGSRVSAVEILDLARPDSTNNHFLQIRTPPTRPLCPRSSPWQPQLSVAASSITCRSGSELNWSAVPRHSRSLLPCYR